MNHMAHAPLLYTVADPSNLHEFPSIRTKFQIVETGMQGPLAGMHPHPNRSPAAERPAFRSAGGGHMPVRDAATGKVGCWSGVQSCGFESWLALPNGSSRVCPKSSQILLPLVLSNLPKQVNGKERIIRPPPSAQQMRSAAS
jgi:hypothetical protein